MQLPQMKTGSFCTKYGILEHLTFQLFGAGASSVVLPTMSISNPQKTLRLRKKGDGADKTMLKCYRLKNHRLSRARM